MQERMVAFHSVLRDLHVCTAASARSSSRATGTAGFLGQRHNSAAAYMASLLGSMRVPIYRNRWYSGKISDLLCNAVSALEAHHACQPPHCMQACSLLPVQHASIDRLVRCWVQINNGILDSGSIDESQLRGPLHGKQISDMRDRGHNGDLCADCHHIENPTASCTASSSWHGWADCATQKHASKSADLQDLIKA